MKVRIQWLCGLMLGLASAQAGAGLRCGTALITEGDLKIEVLKKCGAPVDKERRTFYRTLRERHAPPALEQGLVAAVEVEEWIYNFGPHRLMHRLRFEHGRLVDIETLDHGFNE